MASVARYVKQSYIIITTTLFLLSCHTYDLNGAYLTIYFTYHNFKIIHSLYANVNETKPKEYWDYEKLSVTWG